MVAASPASLGSPVSPEPDTAAKTKRLAPRSISQFRVGPPFAGTKPVTPIYASGGGEAMPIIAARVDRGFNFQEGEWIGYKRNYFTLVAAFRFVGLPLDVLAHEAFFAVAPNGIRSRIACFKIRLTSECVEDACQPVTLVQHTAKRDRGPQSLPPVYLVVPGELPNHDIIKLVANIRNTDKIDQCDRLFHLPKAEKDRLVAATPACALRTYPDTDEISLVARYERIQFLSAGCGCRKTASMINKHYALIVWLLGITEDEQEIVIAKTESLPLIVRGRSPSNYPLADAKLQKAALVNFAECTPIESDQENVPETRKREFDLQPKSPKNRPSKMVKLALTPNANLHLQANSHLAQRHVVHGELLGYVQLKNGSLVLDRLAMQMDDSHGKSRLFEIWNLNEIAASNRARDLPSAYCWKEPDHPKADLLVHQPSPHKLKMHARNPFSSPNFERGVVRQNTHREDIYRPVTPRFNPNFPIVGQDLNFSPLSRHSLLDSSGELNVARLSSAERYRRAMMDYESTLQELENLETVQWDCYLSTPYPVAFSLPLYTSTPLQLRVQERAMRPNILTNLHPNVTRCKHGFKTRSSRAKGSDRQFTYADLYRPELEDKDFAFLREQVENCKLRVCPRIPLQPEELAEHSGQLSPLTLMHSDEDKYFIY